MASALFIPEIVNQHSEAASSLWVSRDHAVGPSPLLLRDIVKLDDRLDAHLDGLRIAEAEGWSAPLDDLDHAGAGEFFVYGVLALRSSDPRRLDQIIACAFARAARASAEPYHPAYDPWR